MSLFGAEAERDVVWEKVSVFLLSMDIISTQSEAIEYALFPRPGGEVIYKCPVICI